MNLSERKRVLLADNSSDYRDSLRTLLELEDYDVEEATSVEEATLKLQTARLDLALLDLRLTDDDDRHDFSGLEVAKLARELGVPCVVVTAFDTVEATRCALRSRGRAPLAVDLVPKRDGPEALLDGIAIVLAAPNAPRAILVDLEQGLAWLRGEQLRLSKCQYALLAHLYRRGGAVCAPDELLKVVYEEDVPPGQASADKRLERLVNRLRQKIEVNPSEPRYLLKVHGRGYRLVTDE